MRIHHVAPHFHPEIGGLEESVLRFASWQASHGHEVVVHTSALGVAGDALPREGSVDGIRILRYPPVVVRGYFRTWFRPAISGADVVHLHGYAVRTNDYVARRLRGTPIAFSLHHGVLMPHPTASTRLLRRLYDAVTGVRTLRRVDRVLAASSREVPWLLGHGVPESRVRVLPTPLPDESFEPGDPSWARSEVGPRFLLYLGRLHEEKGVDDLLEAFAALPADTRLAFAGPDGGRLDGLRRRARDLAVESRVAFLGRVTEAQKRSLLAACTALVLPSAYEAQGLAALEAWAQGRPVVVTRVGALAELVADGQTGLVVPYHDLPALADALRRICGSTDSGEALGARGRAAAEGFRIADLGPRLDAIYAEIVHR